RPQGRRVRRHPYGQAHGTPGGAPDRDGAPGERGNRFPSIALEREPEVILAVEAQLLDSHDPGRVADARGDAGEEPRTQRVDRLRAEQREVTRALGRFQLRDVVDELRQLSLRERG